MTKRVLVTGGAGFIGSHLVDQLVADGAAVTVLDDFSVGVPGNLADARKNGDVRVVTGSILETERIDEAIEGCDRVYHLAVQCVRRSLGDPINSHEVNATGTIRVLEAARRCKVERFIYCSSSEVYGNASTGRLSEDETICQPITVYGAAKLAGEMYADAYRRTYSLPTTIIRPFNAYGPRAYQTGTRAEVLPRFVGRVLNGHPPIVFGDGSTGRDFTYVTELARGILAAGRSNELIGERVNIAYGRMVTVGELAEIVLVALGRNDLRVAGRDARPGDVHQLHADTRKAEKMLGYCASISIEEGVRLYIDWVRSTYPDVARLIETSDTNWSWSNGS